MTQKRLLTRAAQNGEDVSPAQQPRCWVVIPGSPLIPSKPGMGRRWDRWVGRKTISPSGSNRC